ncbi:MAG: hypothetical protein EPO21_14140 [Chloroflexota bacterium]|nr:MAG: hypothetical protein EPO21_14140 [Chloroflexota bacterium]
MKNATVKGYGIYLEVVEQDSKKVIQCNQCGTVLCGADDNWQAHAITIKSDLVGFMDKVCGVEVAPPVGEPKLLMRRLYCPSCQVCFETEAIEAS